MSTETLVIPEQEKKDQQKEKHCPMYNVILLNDNDHTFTYVVRMLKVLFGFPEEKGMQIALEVHNTGKAILITTTKEHAELKQEQIHSFGPDPLIPRCKGSMTAIIEPAE
jgi:ATP-dependent Clp protease adaptor protein ClpS